MRGMNRYFDDGQHLHGSEEAANRHCRAWALLSNFRPWNPATARANKGWKSPAGRVNGTRRHVRGRVAPAAPTKFERERTAFYRLLPELLATHRGQYVAVHGEQVADSGSDRLGPTGARPAGSGPGAGRRVRRPCERRAATVGPHPRTPEAHADSPATCRFEKLRRCPMSNCLPLVFAPLGTFLVSRLSSTDVVILLASTVLLPPIGLQHRLLRHPNRPYHEEPSR